MHPPTRRVTKPCAHNSNANTLWTFDCSRNACGMWMTFNIRPQRHFLQCLLKEWTTSISCMHSPTSLSKPRLCTIHHVNVWTLLSRLPTLIPEISQTCLPHQTMQSHIGSILFCERHMQTVPCGPHKSVQKTAPEKGPNQNKQTQGGFRLLKPLFGPNTGLFFWGR